MIYHFINELPPPPSAPALLPSLDRFTPTALHTTSPPLPTGQLNSFSLMSGRSVYTLSCSTTCSNQWLFRIVNLLKKKSSRGGFEVEQWSDNRNLSILVDQSPLGGMHDYMVPMDPLCYVHPGCVLYVCVIQVRVCSLIKWSMPEHGITWREK